MEFLMLGTLLIIAVLLAMVLEFALANANTSPFSPRVSRLVVRTALVAVSVIAFYAVFATIFLPGEL